MKAVSMLDIGNLKVENVEKPKIGKEEVLLKIMAVGICGSDIPRINKTGSHIIPIIPGHEFAGEIVELGAEVRDWKIGDRVTAAPLLPCYECKWCEKGYYSLCENYKYYGSRNNGAFAQYLAVNQRNLVELGEKTPFDWGATIDPAANAIHASLRAKLNKEDNLIVFGMGAIGLFAIQYAKSIGVKKIIAVDINNKKLEDAKKSGADYVINSKDEDLLAKISDYTEDSKISVALEMSGSPIAQVQAIESVDKRGRVVYLGISHSNLDIPPHLVEKILRQEIEIMGSWNSFSDPFPGYEWTGAAKLMEEGKLNPDKIITHKLELEDVPKVFKKIDEEPFYFNKIMFYPHGVVDNRKEE